MSKTDWEMRGVRFHWIPMRDYTESAAVNEYEKAVAFINDVATNSGKSVYVHCKAGRTRSTTVVVCYLMQVQSICIIIEYICRNTIGCQILQLQQLEIVDNTPCCTVLIGSVLMIIEGCWINDSRQSEYE